MTTEAAAASSPPKRRRRGCLTVLGVLLLAVTLLVLWLVFVWGTERRSWREFIVFEDGTRIEIRRHKKLVKVWHEWPAHVGWQTRRNGLRLPDGVRFDTVDRLSLIRLEPGSGAVRWILIASPLYCEEFVKYGKPRPDYIQFEYVDGGWTYRAVEPRFFGKPANLLILDQGVPASGVVTEAERERWNSTAERIANKYLVITVDDRDWEGINRHCSAIVTRH
jgi:hypothetical protein